MKKLQFAIVFLALLGFVQLLLPSAARACSCARPLSPQDALQYSGAVFSGKALSITPVQHSGYTSKAVRFQVSSTWKGVSQPEIVVMTAWDSAACGDHFSVGDDYLVYAHISQENPRITVAGNEFTVPLVIQSSLSTSLCSGNKLLASAGPDLAVLGPGKQPVERGFLPYLLLAVVLAVIILVLFRLATRKSRRELA